MANDLIAAPEIIILAERLFYFSPLNDFELSRLSAWCSWRAGEPIRAISQLGFEHLITPEGSAQLLHYSTARTDNLSIIEAADFIAVRSVICQEIYNFWYDLNFPAIDVFLDKHSIRSQKPSKTESSEGIGTIENIYAALSAAYNWTPQQIALLTPYQQLVYRQQIIDMTAAKSTVTLSTEADLIAWQLKQQTEK